MDANVTLLHQASASLASFLESNPSLNSFVSSISPAPDSPKTQLSVALVALSGLWVLYQRLSSHRSKPLPPPHFPTPITSSSTETGEVPNKDRASGEWTPVSFAYPSITPSPASPAETKPVPYRPFRWGQYHITMGIRSMPWSEWIELDAQYASYHAIKAQRVKERGEKLVKVLPEREGVVAGGQAAASELVQELSEYLSRRYPTHYKITRFNSVSDSKWPGWDGLPAVKTITIVPLDATYELSDDNAMEVSAMLIQDDLALMVEGKDGNYYFQAGAIILPGFWRIEDKIGLSLDEIHVSGNVPQFREKLKTSMERFFLRLPLSKPVIRNNYFVQIVQPNPSPIDIDPDELAWSNTSNGTEDAFAHGHPFSPSDEVKAIVKPEILRLRTERQTLRRLPRSGAVCFTVRTYLFKVEDLGRERGVPGRMASSVRSWGEDVQIYKGQANYRDVLLKYLDECHQKQVELGEVGAEEQVPAAYPY